MLIDSLSYVKDISLTANELLPQFNRLNYRGANETDELTPFACLPRIRSQFTHFTSRERASHFNLQSDGEKRVWNKQLTECWTLSRVSNWKCSKIHNFPPSKCARWYTWTSSAVRTPRIFRPTTRTLGNVTKIKIRIFQLQTRSPKKRTRRRRQRSSNT